jgi:phage-related protein
MPQVNVVLFRDEDGTVPLLDWLDGLERKVQVKCWLRIKRLQALGYELRRAEADYLRDGVYELRASLGGIHYRMLYFFHRRTTTVVCHGLIKQKAVPPNEIETAILRKRKFEKCPPKHTHLET